MMKIIFISIFFLIFNFEPTFCQEKKGITVHDDPRLSIIVKENKTKNKLKGNTPKPVTKLTQQKNTTSSSDKVFRVQIYNGINRLTATRIREEFDKSYPNLHSYLTYLSPNFRVRIGDFKVRKEALGIYKELNATYGPCMIVPDQLLQKKTSK